MLLLVFAATSNYNNVFHSVEAQTSEKKDEKLYVLLFEQNNIGNIDNSTKMISSIVGTNLIKIEEEHLEELSLAPSQQLEEQVSGLITNGTNGLPCNVLLTTQDGENVGIDCISSEKHIIWHIYPN